jgi:hypothetical protein
VEIRGRIQGRFGKAAAIFNKQQPLSPLTTDFSLGMFERLQCEEVRPPKQRALNGRSGRQPVD